MLASEVQRTLREKCLASENTRIVVAVSGGADSMALLHTLLSGPWKISVGHFSHQIRPEAEAETEFLARLCSAWGVSLHIGRADVPAEARAGKVGLEEAAREARYRYLMGLAQELEAEGLVLGHNQDDNLETILMHFLRGSGLSGLRGLSYHRTIPVFSGQIPLLRPLLAWTKADILAYCRENEIAFVQDPSNLSPAFYRNRLRHELMPLLDALNPAWRRNVLRNAALAKTEAELLDDLSEDTFKDFAEFSTEGLSLDGAGFLRQAPALQTRFLHQALKKLAPQQRDLGYEQVKRLRRAILEGRKGMHLGDGLEMRRQGVRFWLGPTGQPQRSLNWPQLLQKEEQWFLPGESIELAAGWRLNSELIFQDPHLLQRLGKERWEAWLPYTGAPLSLRPVRQGERMRPLGMQGQQKISDIFINLKLPHLYRAAWPLVCIGAEAAWLAGLRQAEEFRLSGTEKKVLHLFLVQE